MNNVFENNSLNLISITLNYAQLPKFPMNENITKFPVKINEYMEAMQFP